MMSEPTVTLTLTCPECQQDVTVDVRLHLTPSDEAGKTLTLGVTSEPVGVLDALAAHKATHRTAEDPT